MGSGLGCCMSGPCCTGQRATAIVAGPGSLEDREGICCLTARSHKARRCRAGLEGALRGGRRAEIHNPKGREPPVIAAGGAGLQIWRRPRQPWLQPFDCAAFARQCRQFDCLGSVFVVTVKTAPPKFHWVKELGNRFGVVACQMSMPDRRTRPPSCRSRACSVRVPEIR